MSVLERLDKISLSKNLLRGRSKTQIVAQIIFGARVSHTGILFDMLKLLTANYQSGIWGVTSSVQTTNIGTELSKQISKWYLVRCCRFFSVRPLSLLSCRESFCRLFGRLRVSRLIKLFPERDKLEGEVSQRVTVSKVGEWDRLEVEVLH